MQNTKLRAVKGFDNMDLEIKQIGGISYDSNIYYLAADEPVLIDTGTGFHNKETIKQLKEIKDIDKLSRIILTHNHADHSGGTKELVDEFGFDVYAHEADANALIEGNGNVTGAIMFGFKQQKLDIKFINDGDSIDCGHGVSLKVIHTPGHSPGSISLYHQGSKSLICGDLAFMDGGVGRWDLPGGDYKLLVKSYEKVLDLELTNFYPGHGPSNEGEAESFIRLSYRYLKSFSAFE